MGFQLELFHVSYSCALAGPLGQYSDKQFTITVSYDKTSAFHKGLAKFLKSTPGPSIVLSVA